MGIRGGFKAFLAFILIFQVVFARVDNCRNVLHWIYKELTLENLDKSYDRLMNKFLIGLIHVHNKTKRKYGYNPELARIMNSLKEIDSDFEEVLRRNRTNWLTSLFLRDDQLPKSELTVVFESWKNLQSTSPSLFEGLEEKYLLDDWDMVTVDALNDLSQYEFENARYRERLNILARSLNQEQTNVLSGGNIDVENLQNQIDLTHNQLKEALNGKYKNIMDEYGYACTDEDLNLLINREEYTCPLPDNSNRDISDQLADIGSILNDTELLLMDKPKIKIGNNTEVYTEVYPRNEIPESTYCLRSPELASMIVVHHTQTNDDMSPQEINEMHLNRTTDGEPWYMIGYNYLLSETYSSDGPSIIQGRAENVRGAHAGGYTERLTEDERNYFSNKTVLCGNKTIGFEERPALSQMDDNGGISGNLVSFGIAVVGNYSPIEFNEINGVMVPANLYSSRRNQPRTETLRKLAQFACDIQTQYPRVRTIVPHQFFKDTSCPGSIKNELHRVAAMAQEMGCQFEVKLSKGENQ